MTDATEHQSRHRGEARRIARVAAVQALYQMDVAHTDLNAVVREFVDERFRDAAGKEHYPDADDTFFSDLVRGVVAAQREIDPEIEKRLAKGWHLHRIDATLRAILRCATFELARREDVPARVVINEYIDVAHAFFDGDEPGVVNGVLDDLARHVRASEFSGPARA